MSETYFLDLDGTLVFHNVFSGFVKDTILPGVKEFLKDLMERNCYTVLTTARTEQESISALKLLKEEVGFEFDQCVFNLPAWKRTIVNDTSEDGRCKAFAISVERNKGM